MGKMAQKVGTHKSDFRQKFTQKLSRAEGGPLEKENNNDLIKWGEKMSVYRRMEFKLVSGNWKRTLRVFQDEDKANTTVSTTVYPGNWRSAV